MLPVAALASAVVVSELCVEGKVGLSVLAQQVVEFCYLLPELCYLTLTIMESSRTGH